MVAGQPMLSNAAANIAIRVRVGVLRCVVTWFARLLGGHVVGLVFIMDCDRQTYDGC